jgi:hypothetical protein
MPTLLRQFHEIIREGTISHSFFEASTTHISNTRRRHNTKKKKKNYWAISLMNIDTNFFMKIRANRIQQHIKKITYHAEVSIIPKTQGWFNIHKVTNVVQHINRIKR